MEVINTCGATNVVCFDKTGTLTEDGLDFHRARALMKRYGRERDVGYGMNGFGCGRRERCWVR